MALLEVGAEAPEFAISDQDGTTATLAEFRGKHVVLWWYPKADTPG